MYKALKKFGVDWFIIAIALLIFAAWLYPEIGIGRKPLSLNDIAVFGVSCVFFFYGLKLDGAKLIAGLRNVKLHCAIHVTTFLIFPLLVLSAMYLIDFSPEHPKYYQWLGIFFLAALPSTVTSSVVMVSIAGGNIPAAIFNASISSLIGVFLTPLWMGIFIDANRGGYPIGDIIIKLIVQVIVPLCLGLALNKKLGKFVDRHKTALRYFDQSTVLLIIYASFCQSFYDKMFSSYSFATLTTLTVEVTLMFFAIYGLLYIVARLLKFDRQDSITTMFCGSKKSLMHGSIMANVIFSNSAIAGVVLLPTMIYHAAQLVIISAIAQSYARKNEELERLSADS